MRYITALLFIVSTLFSCKNSNDQDARVPISESETLEITKSNTSDSSTSDITSDLKAISTKDFRSFKVLDSKYLTKSRIWNHINPQLKDFTEADYKRLKPFILEQDIASLQQNISEGKFNYELLTKFYLYRIRKYDRENELSLNSVISINPNVIDEAKQLDKDYDLVKGVHLVYGMPILLKDNINASNMPTTAGAVALQNNITSDAFIVQQLKAKGALILGKANLSEWAYFFCGDCPSGYSAIGGQTLNPYGRGAIDTGGSSSGSGVAVSANFAAATIGSETSGSILSPASQNSVVGLKPTIGLVSRSGIVPISSTLDTAGPITRTVYDAAIIIDAIFGEDTSDSKTINAMWSPGFYTDDLKNASLEGKRFGVPKRLMADSSETKNLYVKALEVLKQNGAEIIGIEEETLGLPNFLRLLNLDMKKDLPKYMASYSNSSIVLRTVADVINFNKQDSLLKMPYGQKLFKGIANDNGTDAYLKRIKDTLKTNGLQYFNTPMTTYNLDGFISINNYHAGFAAVAEYPAITVPMGYTTNGVPKGLTFIAKRLHEKQLLEWAYVYEQATNARVAPKAYN